MASREKTGLARPAPRAPTARMLDLEDLQHPTAPVHAERLRGRHDLGRGSDVHGRRNAVFARIYGTTTVRSSAQADPQ